MNQIVECVPNFSNGRDPEIYNGIAETIRSVAGVQVLDVSADPDHNRTVITFVGPSAGVEEAAFRSIAYARSTSTWTSIAANTRAWAQPTCAPSSPSPT
jgi:glutamate formiminotransferase